MLGKHFAVDGGNLYVFTTGTDALLNLNSFPWGLGLFGADTAWRVSPWVAVVEDVLQRQLEKAQIVLRLHGYEKTSLSSDALEAYFLDGRELRVVERVIEGQTPLLPITVDVSEED
jgi:hypothetical protein